MKTTLFVSIFLIALFAIVTILPWQAYYVIAGVIGVICFALRKDIKVWGED